MTIEQYNSLTEDERQFIYVVINEVQPPILQYHIPESCFISIKHNMLMNRLLQCEVHISLEYREFYKNLMEKLKN
jgi:hypothetical protein